MKARISTELEDQFVLFLQQHPPRTFSASLRRMLLEYMIAELDSGMDTRFSELLASLNDLFDLLDMAALEIQNKGGK